MSGLVRFLNVARALPCLLSLALFVSVGCGVTASVGTTAPGGTLAITPVTSSLPLKSETQLHLLLITTSGQSTDVSENANWTSSNPAIAAVSTTGVLTTMATGAVTIRASLLNDKATSTFTVDGLQVTSLNIISPQGSIVQGSTVQYAAIATYSDQSTQNISAHWASSDTEIATINITGLLAAVSAGNFTVTATVGSLSATASSSVSGPSESAGSGSGIGTGTGTSDSWPIAIYTGVDFSKLPVFNVSSYSASGSAASGTCTGHAGSRELTCNGLDDLVSGQGIRIVGGGKAPAEMAITEPPLVTLQGKSTDGSHTYCYVVDAVDPLGGISAPSPQTCVANQPNLSVATASNALAALTPNEGPSPSFLWYVSEDGSPFLLLNVAQSSSNAIDLGQRIGSRGGWPDNLPFANPSVAKQQDLFSTVKLVNGDHVIIADALFSSVEGSPSDHDDTQAVENAVLAAVQAGGGTVSFGPGCFNLRRPAFPYLVNRSNAYPTFGTDLSLDPWWARYSSLYIPNGSSGNINFQGAGRTTTLVMPPDHGGAASLLAVGEEARSGAAPIFGIQDVPAGATQITLNRKGEASAFSPGDDIFVYSGSFGQAPEVDAGGLPGMHHFSELNTVDSVSEDTLTLVYPTSKRYFDDGGSSFGLTKMPVTPHNVELQHLNVNTFNPITSTGDVIGMLVNDVQIHGVVSNGAFGGGYKRGMTIENSQWTFGEGTSGWGQTDEYDQFTDLAFLNNSISGFAAAGAESSSGMAKLYMTEGTSEVLFQGNTLDHVSVYAQETTAFYVQDNTFMDGIVAAGDAYGAYTTNYDPNVASDRSFLSFGSQDTFSAAHNTFTISSDYSPPWLIRAGNFSSGSISNNVITYSGASTLWFVIGTFNGAVLDNSISINSPTVGNIITLIPDQSPRIPTSSFDVEANVISGHTIAAGIALPNPGFTDTAPVCVQDNTLNVSKGVLLNASSSIVNRQCF